MTTVLQRVCWNTDSWKKPSGATFDSGNPGDHGYGNEEWNFCKEDALGGKFVFGWLYWRAEKFKGKRFQILFWTICPPRKEWVLVGAYHDASIATEEDTRKLERFFEKERIGERRRSEALAVVDSADEKRWIRKHPPAKAVDLKFKCPVDKVEIFHPYRSYSSLPKKFRSKNPRFKNPTIFEESIGTVLKTASRPPTNRDYVLQPSVAESYLRATPASLKIIIPRHERLSNAFIRWLDRTGRRVVGRERNRVDVEFEEGSNSCLAELKVCYGMTPVFAIREALGQLLEYNYYGWRIPADRWFVVLDSKPSEQDLSYVQKLSEERKLPLVLLWKSGNDFVDNSLS